jgi:2-polyprenyl-6-methoxyphenol hydroxylase-like FAD-dependent oxidoreductase
MGYLHAQIAKRCNHWRIAGYSDCGDDLGLLFQAVVFRRRGDGDKSFYTNTLYHSLLLGYSFYQEIRHIFWPYLFAKMFKAYPERDPLLDIDVIVVGAGPGGLVAAIELWRIGCNVRVLEARSQDESAHGEIEFLFQMLRKRKLILLNTGGPFGLGIPVLRHLQNIPGLKETLMTACYKVQSSWYTSSGKLIGGPFHGGSADDPGPALLTLTDRERFVKYLVEFLGHLNIPIQYDSRVVDYSEDKNLKKSFAVTAAGETLEADLIVAADGVGTKSWKLIAKERQLPKPSGFSIFRGSIPASSYLQNPILREEFGEMDKGYGHVRFYLGQDSHAVVVVTPDKIAFDLTRKVRHIQPSHPLELPVFSY